LETPRAVDPVPVPKIVDIREGVAVYDENQARKQPDWSYDDEWSGSFPADVR